MQFVAGAGKVEQVTTTVHEVPHSLTSPHMCCLLHDLMFTAQIKDCHYIKAVNVFSVNCTSSALVLTCANYIYTGRILYMTSRRKTH